MRDFSSIAHSEVFTLHDLVHRILLRTSGNPTDRTQAMLARAIQDAVRSLPAKHEWNYFNRQSRLTTSPAVNLAIEYTHTGGAKERLVTATSGVFPPDASMGELLIGDETYRVDTRVSDVAVTLESDFSPRENLTGEATWVRTAYQFSREMVKIKDVRSTQQGYSLTYLAPSDFSAMRGQGWSSGTPTYFTYQNSGGVFGSSDFVLFPAPTSSIDIEVSGTVTPLIPQVNLVSGIKASTTSTNIVTSPNSQWDRRLIGCVFRLGRDEKPPTGFDYDNWEFQAFITEVSDAHTLVLSESAPSTVANRGFSISSPMDLEASVMLEYIEDEAYHQYTKNHNHKSFPMARNVASESLRMAIARDNKVSRNGYLQYPDGAMSHFMGGFYTVSCSE